MTPITPPTPPKGPPPRNQCGPLLVLVVAVFLLPAPVQAQDRATTGKITGLVADTTGGVLPGAAVRAVNLDTGLVRNGVSDDSGTYGLVLLPPGPYDVAVELAGFGAAELERRDACRRSRPDHQLHPGSGRRRPDGHRDRRNLPG